ncbi:MAG: 3-phosphoshikimate 1-carboxyvinyltransferase [Clostridia bacterium]|nr:3-phosphoshikimate 1-carboxyvinyltransferase [Clostridia bacterium]
MKVTITPSELRGQIAARASKSQAHRQLICAALSDTPCTIYCDSLSEDILATADCLNALGAEIKYSDGSFSVNPITVPLEGTLLDCRESGSTLRFMVSVVAALGANSTFKMSGRLAERPLSPLAEELEAHGIKLSRPTDDTLKVEGKLTGGNFTLDGSVSSQFVSGLLFALPLLKEESSVTLTGDVQSVDYITMTVRAIKSFGVELDYKDNTYTIKTGSYHADSEYFVEGDWSNGAFWICAGRLTGGRIVCTNLDAGSPQGDKEIAQIASALTENGLSYIEIDASNIPDLVPVICVTASATDGAVTVIKNAGRLRIKESDRIKSTAELINNLGGKAEETDDGLIITGVGKFSGGKIDSFNDHRIAMSGAIASLISDGVVEIAGAEAVNKSYPSFWEDFKALGGKITVEN